MVKCPYSVDGDFSLKKALGVMLECNIRHLPITEGERLVGLVSDRDLKSAMSLPQAEGLTVADIMKTELYVATKTSSLANVVRTMAEQKIGSALVVNERMECLGIFTTTDALEILADLLESEDDSSNILGFKDYVDYWHMPQVENF